MTKNSTKFTLPFLVLTVLFCVCLIVANLVEIKTVALGPLTVTAGMVVFPVSYIINDCLVEVYGFRKARLVIWLGFIMNLFVTLMLQLAIILPGASSWGGQEAMPYTAMFRAYLPDRFSHLYAGLWSTHGS